MSLFKSFWQDPSASHSAQDATASGLIPLPTVSMLLDRSKSPRPQESSKPSLDRRRYDPADPLIPLQKAEAALERQLQDYLDAQTAALFPQADQNEASMSASRMSGAVPRRQPAPRTMSLSDARRGISQAMADLSRVKARQLTVVDRRAQNTKSALDMVNGWQAKENDLKAEVDAVRASGNDDEMRKLKDEDHALQQHIDELESKLSELRSQQRAVKMRLSKKANALDSDVASFRESLSLLESQRRSFLQRPSPDLFRSLPESTFVSLKPERRTPQLAQEALKEARDAESGHAGAISDERSALDDGAAIWNEVVRQVTRIETAIRSEMESLSKLEDGSAAELSMDRLLTQLESAVSDFEKKLNDAEKSGRSLLVCCIGAELEALQNGREILKRTLQASKQGTSPSVGPDSSASTSAPASPVHEFRPRAQQQDRDSTGDETDGDPQSLLIATHDTDTD